MLLYFYLYPLRMIPHRLVATDIVHAIPLAVVAGMGYLFAGMVDARTLIGEFCSCRFLESQLTAKVSCRWVQVALALVLLAAGINVTI